MEQNGALLAFAALSQSTRLDVFRLLIAFEPTGLAAGEVARRLAVPKNTLSAHLGVLTRAGLITAERRSRSIVYRADLGSLGALVEFLTRDCCGGDPRACGAPSPTGSAGHPNPEAIACAPACGTASDAIALLAEATPVAGNE